MMSETIDSTTPVATAPVTPPITHVTPNSTGHRLHGGIFAIIKEEGEYLYAELKDGIHWIEARFHKSEVLPVAPPAVAAVHGTDGTDATKGTVAAQAQAAV